MAELFLPFKRMPASMGDLEAAIIANSETLNLGDAIYALQSTSTNQFVKGSKGNPTGKILGVVQGFRPISTSSSNLTAEQTSFTAASNNQTVSQFAVLYEPARLHLKYLATLDNPVGTTTGSNYFGMFNMSTGVNGLTESSFVVLNSGQSGTLISSSYQFSSIGNAQQYGQGFSTSQVVGFFMTVA